MSGTGLPPGVSDESSRTPSTPGPVVVWGAGAMGGTIGARLIRAGREVLFVDADAAHARAICDHGLRISGPIDDFTVPATCVTPENVTASLSVVLLAVKAHHTTAAMEAIRPLLAPAGFVVSVQNGLNEHVIADSVGVERTVGCFVNYGADVIEPGVIIRGNRGAVVVGELDGARTPRIEWVHRLFLDFEPDAVLTSNILGFLWGKLAYGSMLFATALADASIADVLDASEHRPSVIRLAREAMAVAEALGIEPESFDGFDPSAFSTRSNDAAAHASLDRLVSFNRASAKTHSGVWRDLAVRKRRTEVDAQIAPIATLGAGVGIETPLTVRLVELIHDVEEGRRSQSWQTIAELTRVS